MVVTNEMIEAAARAICAAHGYRDPYIDTTWRKYVDHARASLTAALAAAPVVEVKPLEWEEHWGGADDDLPSWRGKNPLGLHVSVDFIGKYKLERHSDAPQDELAAAKSAAQADYTARIMSALATTETNGHE